MLNKGCNNIPRELCDWIIILGESLPLRAVRTCLELLIGTMLTRSGFVTQSWLVMNTHKHWTSYYKCLQKGKWSWLLLARAFVRLVIREVGGEIIYLAIDDTLVLRASKKAPASDIHHQHGNKPNLARFVRGQCWVTLAQIAVRARGNNIAIPLLSRLMPTAGNTGKLRAAQTLIRSVSNLYNGKTVRLLVDSWYMRGKFITAMLSKKIEVIGQVRYDTRLYDIPAARKPKQCGRPAIYGHKMSAARVTRLSATETVLPLYGKQQRLRYRDKILLARFIDGTKVRAIWCEFYNEKTSSWNKPRLLLSTNIELPAEDVITIYAKRWSIESAFHELKNTWGIKEAWQQTRKTLNRWVQLTTIGYGLIQLLSLLPAEKLGDVMLQSPWRDKSEITAGKIRDGLVKQFQRVSFFDWWGSTCKKIRPPS
ncbi:MAG: transposase [Marinagarivorans sp.]|nr:transposase [Marinagarivorans sp.]